MSVLPTWEVGAIFVISCVVSTMAATALVHRTAWFKRLSKNAEFISIMYPMIGAIYGVVLAFTIVLSWQRFALAEAHTSSEVTHLSSLRRNAQVFACQEQRNLEARLMAYIRTVVACEWKTLALNGRSSRSADLAYEEIWAAYREYIPNSYTEKRFYEAGLKQLNELGIERRHRIMSATAEISGIVWIFLCMGGIVTVTVPMLVSTKQPRMQIWLNGIMTFIISFSLWIIAALQYPYSGDVKVSDKLFVNLADSFEQRRNRERDGQCPVETLPVEPPDCGKR